jgi:hypothetical protein
MKTDPEVERWFAERKPPTMRKVREAFFVQASDKKQTSLMFNRGARIPGKFPHLEGSHPSARFMPFADPAEATARAAELSKIVAAWGALTPADRGPAKPTPKR